VAHRVLVVDDEPGVRGIIARMLEEVGYRVTEVGDALGALAAVRCASPPFDLVVTDNHMPAKTGLRLVDELQAEFPALPIVMLTGMPLVDALPDTPRVRYLAKPVMPDRLHAVVRGLLAGRAPLRVELRTGWPGPSAH
jgi:CheY-like chemotaxis protein